MTSECPFGQPMVAEGLRDEGVAHADGAENDDVTSSVRTSIKFAERRILFFRQHDSLGKRQGDASEAKSPDRGRRGWRRAIPQAIGSFL
jgi:hypothetical protein